LRGASKLFTSNSRSKFAYRPATPFTQQHRREAKGQPAFPFVKKLKPDTICRDCGEQIRNTALFCPSCAVTATGENFDVGRKSAQRPESLAKRSATKPAAPASDPELETFRFTELAYSGCLREGSSTSTR